jgi:hypothetical protein
VKGGDTMSFDKEPINTMLTLDENRITRITLMKAIDSLKLDIEYYDSFNDNKFNDIIAELKFDIILLQNTYNKLLIQSVRK